MSEKPSGKESDKKLRLGGMALANGVLVHGPTSWACAVRAADGELKVASERKRCSRRGSAPLLRGPARLVEAVAFLPELAAQAARGAAAVRAADDPRGAIVASAVAVPLVRRSPARRRRAGARRRRALARAGAARAARRELAAYHGAEHISIGSYEHGEHAREGARALRLASDRAAARDVRRGNVAAARAPAAAPRPGSRASSSARSPRRPRSSAG